MTILGCKEGPFDSRVKLQGNSSLVDTIGTCSIERGLLVSRLLLYRNDVPIGTMDSVIYTIDVPNSGMTVPIHPIVSKSAHRLP